MFFTRISFRIAALYAGAFFISALILFAFTAYFLLSSLQVKDRDLLNEKIGEYANLYERDGIRGLQLRATSRSIRHAQDFVVRLSNPAGTTLFIHVPDRDDVTALSLDDVDGSLSRNPRGDGWSQIPSGDFGDSIELVTRTLSDSSVLQVGKDTEDREEFFESFLKVYFRGLIPTVVISLFAGWLFANRLLKPIRWLRQTVERIRSGKSTARVPTTHVRDELTDLGQLFNQMLDENARLVQGMRETVDNVAHDLRTPIMRLQASVDMTLQSSASEAGLRDALVESKENSQMILRLIDTIMDISEAEAGTLKLNREVLQIEDIVHLVVDLYGFHAEEKQMTIEIRSLVGFQLFADRVRLMQVLSNLLDNAIKYSPAGTTITLETSVQEGLGVLTVSDQGVGIGDDKAARIWDRLYREDSSRNSRGLGLGLSLVKAIVEAHGGRASVTKTASGVGASFRVSIPRMTNL